MAQAREYSAVICAVRCVGDRSGLSERFAACPPACGLLLYLRKTFRQPTPQRAWRGRSASTLVVTGVVCLSQRGKGGGHRPGDTSGGRHTAPDADSAHGVNGDRRLSAQCNSRYANVQHQAQGCFDALHGLSIHDGDAFLQTGFVYNPDLLDAGFGSRGEIRQCDQQRPGRRAVCAGQRDDDDGAANAVDFGFRHHNARPGFGDFGTSDGVQIDPIDFTAQNACIHGLARGGSFACALANSFSKATGSKPSSSSSVRTALTHSSVSWASSGYCASISFNRVAASASNCWVALSLSAMSFASRSTMYRLRCRGGTAFAKRHAKSSGRRSSTCLGGDVCVFNMIQ